MPKNFCKMTQHNFPLSLFVFMYKMLVDSKTKIGAPICIHRWGSLTLLPTQTFLLCFVLFLCTKYLQAQKLKKLEPPFASIDGVAFTICEKKRLQLFHFTSLLFFSSRRPGIIKSSRCFIFLRFNFVSRKAFHDMAKKYKKRQGPFLLV